MRALSIAWRLARGLAATGLILAGASAFFAPGAVVAVPAADAQVELRLSQYVSNEVEAAHDTLDRRRAGAATHGHHRGDGPHGAPHRW